MTIKLIAETAAHHGGDYDFMLKLTDMICESSADIVKVHVTQDIDEYMDRSHSVYELLAKWIFSPSQWEEIFGRISNASKSLMTLVNDTKAVELAAAHHPAYFEIHSVALNDINLLAAVKANLSSSNKIVLGVGGSTLEEIENAIALLNTDRVVLMFGFQNYPTRYEDVNFRKMQRIMQIFPDYKFGYADHTAWDEPNNVLITLLGAALGVSFVEKHVTLECGFERIDSSAAVSFDQFEQIRDGLTILGACNGNGRLELNAGERKYCDYGPMKKAPLLRRDMKIGESVQANDICFKRTAARTDLSQIRTIDLFGSKVSRDISAGTILCSSNFTE